MGHTVRGVLFLLPILLCACGAGSSSLAPSQDTAPDVSADVIEVPDFVEDSEELDTAQPVDLPALSECVSDDDCQGLAVAIPACKVVVCAVGECIQVDAEDGVPCHSGANCKDSGVCADGACDQPDRLCEDDDPCTGTSCDPAVGCLFEPLDGAPCDDGDACTATDLCAEGACVGDGTVDCDDGNPCTHDGCDTWFGCVHEDVEGPCDDGNPCTGDDQCTYGVCAGASDICECDKDADCSDLMNACFSAYFCDVEAVAPVCLPVPQTETPCPDQGPCLAGACNPASETCEPVAKPDATPCVDPMACVASGFCVAGTCVGESVVCDGEGTACTVPACVPGEGCVEVPAPGPCDDGDPCTANDWCVDGACASLAVDCAPAPPALFRVSSLTWDGPGLVFTAPGGIEITLDEALDVALDQALDDTYAPLDLLLGIAPMDTSGPATLVFTTDVCLRDGDGLVTGCPWPGDDATLGVVVYSPAPAFSVSGVPGFLALPGALGGPFEPVTVEVSGQLEGLPEPSEISGGSLAFFLTEDAADLVTVTPPLMASLPLGGLLDPDALTSVDDLQGWWIHLEYEAVRTPILP